MSSLPSTIERRIAAFESGDLDPAEFDHTAHVLLALDYLATTRLPDTLARYCDALRRLTHQFGVPEKYHETVTCFLLLKIAERRSAAMPDVEFCSFRRANPDLFTDLRVLLSAYYSQQRLDSPIAREQFLLPDRFPAFASHQVLFATLNERS